MLKRDDIRLLDIITLVAPDQYLIIEAWDGFHGSNRILFENYRADWSENRLVWIDDHFKPVSIWGDESEHGAMLIIGMKRR